MWVSSELFRIVIGCNIFNSSIRSKFIHKIAVVYEKFLVGLLFNLLREMDTTHAGGWRWIQHVRGLAPAHGPRVVHPCSNDFAMDSFLCRTFALVVNKQINCTTITI